MGKLSSIIIKFNRRPALLFMALAMFISPLFLTPNAIAFKDMDTLSGVDRTFTTRDPYDTFGETFHKNEILFEKPVVDEVAKQDMDTWRYYKSFRSGAYHDDNYSATPRDPKGETIYTNAVNTGMSHRTQYTYIKMFYDLSYADYVQNDKANRFSNTQTTDMRFNFNRFKVAINNTFKPDTAFVQGERTELKTTNGKQVITYADSASIALDYKYSPKTTMSFKYGDTVFYFPKTNNIATDNSASSSMIHEFSPKLSYQLTPKTSVFVSHIYSIFDYFKAKDSIGYHQNQLNVGVNGKLFSDVGISLSVGYSYQEFSKSVSPVVKGMVYQAGLSKKILPKVRATVSSTREINNSFDSAVLGANNLISDFYGLNLNWQVLPRVSVDGEASVGYTAREGYVITLADMDNPTNFYTRSREDQLYKWGLRINWTPRANFGLSLAYEFINKNSSFKNNEYYSNQLLGSLNYIF